MRVQCNDIDLLLFLELMQRDGCILTGDEMYSNINVFQIGARLQVLKIMLSFFTISFNNTIGKFNIFRSWRHLTRHLRRFDHVHEMYL